MAEVVVGESLGEVRREIGTVDLFLFSAATWNAHRIHYDYQFAREVEAHPATVVHGPLQGTLIEMFVSDWCEDRDVRLLSLEYRHRRAAYAPTVITISGSVTDIDYDLLNASIRVELGDCDGSIYTDAIANVNLS